MVQLLFGSRALVNFTLEDGIKTALFDGSVINILKSSRSSNAINLFSSFNLISIDGFAETISPFIILTPSKVTSSKGFILSACTAKSVLKKLLK